MALCWGHTEIAVGIDRPIVIGTKLGEVEKDRLVTPAGARPGDDILEECKVLCNHYGLDPLGLIASGSLLSIDEIGKMECFSEPFVRRVREIFQAGYPVLATIPLRGAGEFLEEIRRQKYLITFTVTIENRGHSRAIGRDIVQCQ